MITRRKTLKVLKVTIIIHKYKTKGLNELKYKTAYDLNQFVQRPSMTVRDKRQDNTTPDAA